ncbi:S-phase kinase-associated protein 2-like isoform X2 [Mercenaria mercenaria]|uniref:S-phase kinase-associated protein 2-like isoform X2 n=1 Tax=Mercenaria mercenaria TaxID=6596 RepID=UPI00234F64EE|nr:S-phase kinase-associated protein 2-like isoform X2 [Mercenaria mercenaria]
MPKKRVQRKTSCKDQKENKISISRKRKASSPLEACNQSHTKTTWAVNTERTRDILQDMGVELLSQNSTDSCASNTENFTPATFVKDENSQSSTSSFHLPPVPGAPRILLDSHRDNVTSCSDESSESSLDPNLTPCLRTIQNIPNPNIHFSISRQFKRQRTDTGAYDYFGLLSDEIILAIFAWLPKFVLAKCARVCKKWSRLVLDESLWKRIDLSTKTLSPGVLGHVMSRGVWALRLAKSEIEGPIFTGPTSPIKSTRLSKVQYLDLSMAGTSPEVLEEIFSICKDLRKISLENLEVNDKVCCYIGENKHLTVLNMAMCQGITANGLMPILSNCRKLESLHLGWTGLHRHSIVYLCLCLPPDLQKLNLSGCRENITDDEVLQLCKTCPNLRELDLSDSTSLTNDSVTHIILNLRYLEHIALSRCYHIVPGSITDLNEMPSLLAVEVFGILRENPLKVLKSNLPRTEVNSYPFSSIARPTTGIHRTSIWGIRVRDNAV